jgi:hypothetical protein
VRAPRIQGELGKLGIEVAQSTVAKYICRPRSPGLRSCARGGRRGIPRGKDPKSLVAVAINLVLLSQTKRFLQAIPFLVRGDTVPTFRFGGGYRGNLSIEYDENPRIGYGEQEAADEFVRRQGEPVLTTRSLTCLTNKRVAPFLYSAGRGTVFVVSHAFSL